MFRAETFVQDMIFQLFFLESKHHQSGKNHEGVEQTKLQSLFLFFSLYVYSKDTKLSNEGLPFHYS